VYYPYSQNIYPKRVVVDKDTVTLFSDVQVLLITQTFISEEYLEKEINEYQIMINYYEQLVENKDSQILALDRIIATKDDIIVLKDVSLDNHKEEIKQIKRDKIKAIISSLVIGISTGVLLVLVL
jgi:hypothetical protein